MSLPPIQSPPSSHFGSSLSSSHASFPIIAVAVIGILATSFLLVGYYVFVIKCCLNWHRVDLLGRFSSSRRHLVENHLTSGSQVPENLGLNEAAIRSIPVFKFNKGKGKESEVRNSGECAVCLIEFQEEEKLRIIPNCGHFFHIDCIDVWLQNNANCPLCRTSVSAIPTSQAILAPNPSPQYQNPHTDNFTGRDEDYVVIEIGSNLQSHPNPALHGIEENLNSGEFLSITPSPLKFEPKFLRKQSKKLTHNSSMGDECIDSRQKDEHFPVFQSFRRSFSMDSADDRQLYLAVQQIINQKRDAIGTETSSANEGCSSCRIKRSFFSFGHSRGSRSAVQPVELEALG
ncbi:RING-H2 finger protein ATL16-like [Primulina eburnea]|uniref:RING-H2 finger protein ATL16-like n=1 Tax=Primulina eburnea TaxID=1245227 RepID=UPI003C6BDA04